MVHMKSVVAISCQWVVLDLGGNGSGMYVQYEYIYVCMYQQMLS